MTQQPFQYMDAAPHNHHRVDWGEDRRVAQEQIQHEAAKCGQ